MSDVQQVAEWLVRVGYPFDWQHEARPPDFLLRPLAAAWYRVDNFRDGEAVHSDVTEHDYYLGILDELEPAAPVEGER